MYQFQYQCVRDLAWAPGSPPLVSGRKVECLWPDRLWFQGIAEEARPWLERLDAQPEGLQTLPATPKDRRPGRYSADGQLVRT